MSLPTKELVPGPMSLFDKISLSWLVPLTVSRAFFGFGARMADSSSLHWRQKLSISLLQALRRTLNPRHTFAHSRQRLTGAAVETYCCKRGLDYAAITVAFTEYNSSHGNTQIPCPTLHIVTPANAPANGPVLLYAHGGGYLNPLQAPGHMPFALQCAASCSASRVIFIEYALSSDHVYPAQLIQMVATVKHLLHHGVAGDNAHGGLKPENLILAGDSAGGHLIVSLLVHAVRPSPYVPPLTELSGEKGKQLRAVALFSPWVTMKSTDASFTANHGSDYLSAQQVDIFIRLFEPSPTEVWASPIDAADAADVWKTAFPPAFTVAASGAATRSVVKRTLVTSGAGETLFDSCVKFGAELLHAEMVVLDSDDKVALAAGKDLVLTIAPDEAHVQPVLDSALGYPHGWSMKAVNEFLKSV